MPLAFRIAAWFAAAEDIELEVAVWAFGDAAKDIAFGDTGFDAASSNTNTTAAAPTTETNAIDVRSETREAPTATMIVPFENTSTVPTISIRPE